MGSIHAQYLRHLVHHTGSKRSEVIARVEDMGPRMAQPVATPLPHRGPVGDFGSLANSTGSAAPFTHGLTGVNQAMNWVLSNALLVTFMILLVFTLAYQWSNMVHDHMRRMFTMGRHRDQRYWMHNRTRFWPKVKKYLILAPLGKHRHNKEIQLSSAISIGTLPSRFHTLLLVVYVSSNIAYCLILDWQEPNSAAIIADLRGRSGVLAALNLIPTILFALRNNPLIPLLKVSYDTFNLLHRWCARIVVLESIVHSICWAVNSANAGGSHQIAKALATSMSFRWGLVGTCCFITIAMTAISPVRHAFYEVFLNSHRLLVLFGLIGVYVHLYKANLPHLWYIQLCFIFWVAEWAWRFVKIALLNISRKKGITRVTIEALPAEACRLTFDLSRSWNWIPGCHVHAYLPNFALWSSHPFSIAWAEKRTVGKPLDIELEKLPSHPGLAQTTTRQSFGPSRNSLHARKAGSNHTSTVSAAKAEHDFGGISLPRDTSVTSVSLIIRARTGMTRKIYEKAAAAPGGVLHTWGAIEGPYGGHHSFSSYGTVLLFAGGVGITHCVGFVHHLLSQYQEGTSSTQKILLVWSVPNTEALEWIREWMDKILRMEGRRDVLRIQLFVTKPRHRGEVISNTGSVQMFPGRCNPQTIIEKEFSDRIGAMAVTVCGPGGFADSVRSATRRIVADGAVDLHEEAFTY